LPSAYSLEFFSNQDWVWGLGLIVSGVFMSIATSIHGPIRFKHELIDLDSDFKLSDLYFQTMIYINIALGVFLIYWWMSQGYSSNPWFTDEGNWNWFDTYSNASIVTQWGTVILIGLVLNRFLYHKFCKD
jgi:NSS family neurotransmitter:Na+ symporter